MRKPRIGDVYDLDGQRYAVISLFDDRTRDGRSYAAVVLQTDCAECRSWFELTTTRGRIASGNLVRRCSDHRRPGVAVETKGAKRPEGAPRVRLLRPANVALPKRPRRRQTRKLSPLEQVLR